MVFERYFVMINIATMKVLWPLHWTQVGQYLEKERMHGYWP